MFQIALNLKEECVKEIQENIDLILRQVRPFLAHRSERYDFFYDSFSSAAQEYFTLESEGD
jgi:hypothetical protein